MRELNWHPDVQAAKLGHAGRVHQDASDEFASIHHGYAFQKLNECILGTVTEKAAAFMKKNAEIKAKDLAQSSNGDDGLALQKHSWVPVHLKDRKRPNHMCVRAYIPTRSMLESEEDRTLQLVVKTYFPNDDQPGGAMSNVLDCIPLNEEIEARGQTGEIEYRGNGLRIIEGQKMRFSRIAVIDANMSEADILLKDELHDFKENHEGQFTIDHVFSHPSEDKNGTKEHVNAEINPENLILSRR
ncbi:hypothetical protein HO133_004033 [Letharia lupina]|uniref:Uncharacterized protein n=1 Tax=Letharia lupina TaxID=560253 RepID=A0A8H6CAA0_9LECA|nr:uncharacterized protein HO133_004033 [Letharia lupina]KAF6219564.1 hypothetical protein HO133_004033 [Letharia lupina]